ISAKILGAITERIGITPLVGYIFSGIFLGPVLGMVFVSDFINNFIMIGIIVVLFLAGLEVRYDDIKQSTYRASFLAITGGVLSFIAGFLVGWYFFNSIIIGIAIGTILVSSSNIMLFSILQKTGHFDTHIGRFIVAITIADDVVGIVFLSMFNFMVKHGAVDPFDLMKIFFLSVGFYLFILTFGSKIFSRMIKRLSLFRDEFVLLAIPLAIALFVSFVTENIGLSLATGAFLAGMAIASSDLKDVIQTKTKIISEGFLEPVFYASIGTLLIIANVDYGIIAIIFIVSVIAKLIGAGVLSRFFGFSRRECTLIGISMMPRGNENIVIAQIIFALGVISIALYSSIVFAIIATVIISPILVKICCRNT
ncbi:MAG: cation:proton antiporter, partial [Candidatus Aenigmarchaeota archaeon]|nr:cation:proton antiporter [Candidatus Aenigmarchaeota archaeon]